MANTALFLSVVAVLVSVSLGHVVLFGNQPDHVPRAALIPRDPVCERLADAGSCHFFQCYENRFPCGEAGFVLQYGLHYCNRYMQEFSKFTDEGKLWINASQKCLTRALLVVYVGDTATCSDSALVAENLANCYIDNNFCETAWTDQSLIRQVIHGADLFSRNAPQNWRELLQLVRGCLGQRIRNFFGSLSSMLGN